ncbi:hypothetical protein GGR53DRAFT_478214 [Hypoxylon sp. FL1150]|nr:hypothetical protein GGR53DRAFT_478214 [Hypoxylon sp. FL1150]
MEAVAAIGLASNILQFIDYGHRVIVLAKELSKSGHETTYSNAEAAFVAREMRELGLRLTKDLPTADLTVDEERLCRLARKCNLLSDKLLLLLESLEVRRLGTNFEIIRAVFRNIRKRKERDQLQADLDNYRAQLNVQIAYMSRSDFARKLEATLRNTTMSQQDILYLKDNVQKLSQKPAVDSASVTRFLREIQEIVEIPLRQIAILHAFRYPRMYDRFDNVEPAHQRTFEWLLHGPLDHLTNYQKSHADTENHKDSFSDHDHVTKNDQAKHQKHREFVEWLREEINPSAVNDVLTPHKRSIYHIAGKPGAGKSTLMKFLCENQTTIDYLKEWVGEKRLICAKAFFWRLGEEEQKNLAGLRNCLLHQILTAAPELIPIVFPSNWESDYTNLTCVPADSVFNTLLKDGRVFEKYKMIFFIDGLDEYQGRPTELIRKILGWTAGNSANFKICLSSREWNEFEVGFSGCPRLRIQDWTRDDIQVFVQDSFEGIGHLSTSINKSDLNTIANVVVDKAEGVFLWVRVVLAAIEQGVLNGDDFQDLQRKTNAFPAELKDLYQHLFDSIPEYDRRKAFEVLLFALHNTYEDKPLLQYKFLNDFVKNPDFAMEMPTQPLSEEEVRRFTQNTSRQINGRCKGFLEIFKPKKEYYNGDEHVRLMHSTAAGFLASRRDTLKSYSNDIDVFDLACQSFLALAKSIDSEGFYSTHSQGVWDFPGQAGCPFIIGIDRIICAFDDEHFARPSTKRLLAFLEQFDRVIVLRYKERATSPQTIPLGTDLITRRTPIISFVTSCRVEVFPGQIISILAARSLFVGYFDTGGLYELRTLASESKARKQITQAVLSGISGCLGTGRSIRMLRVLFEAKISPRVSLELLHGDDIITCQLWSWIFTRIIFTELAWEPGLWSLHGPDIQAEERQYRLFELFLQYGAGEDLCLMFGPCFEVIGANRLIVQVSVCESDGTLVPPNRGLNGICVDYQLDIVRYARTRGGVLSFREVLAYCFPRTYPRLFALLDGKSSTSSTSDDAESMPVLFPTANRYFEETPSDSSMPYFFQENRPPKYCKQCLAHSEKCFTDFETKFKDGKLGRPYKPKQPSTYDDDD